MIMRPRFAGPALFAGICLALAGIYGWHETGTAGATLAMLWLVLLLAVLEVSLSFDNAVVNAAVLTGMAPRWRHRFLTWGMAFAVFGTRIAFPLAIVGVTARLGPVDAVTLSLNDPARYEAIVGGAHGPIAGFGGAFLTLVGLAFFTDDGKELHWLGWIERPLKKIAFGRGAAVALVLAVALLVAHGLPAGEARAYLLAAAVGIAGFVAVEALTATMRSRRAGPPRSGLGAFLYLNVLDASFSLDGVIGAFALTRNMVIIAIGLSIGAVFVRSLTMVMVERQTLAAYRYLEHGAFWAILVLGLIMLLSASVPVPEPVTGLIGAVLIGGAWWTSRNNPVSGS